MTDAASMADALEIHPVDGRRWDDLVRLIEGRGGPRHCWCLVWRERGAASRLDLEGRRARMEERVQRGEPIGLLAYREGDPERLGCLSRDAPEVGHPSITCVLRNVLRQAQLIKQDGWYLGRTTGVVVSTTTRPGPGP